LRIAQIAPLWESVPPAGYGAVESVVADLSDSLVARGHKVTLFASGDSKTSAELVAVCSRAFSTALDTIEPEITRMIQLADVQRHAESFDIIHSHLHSGLGCLALPLLTGSCAPVFHTIHSFFTAETIRLFNLFPHERYVAISNDQRSRLPGIDFAATIPHGINVSRFPFRAKADDPPYLAYLGRIRPEKGVDLAIEAARHAGLTLKIAGRVKPQDRSFFDQEIRPRCDQKQVEYLGELGFDAKAAFLGGATACLVTSRIPEPFGLATLEAGACGTPVLALRNGAVSELIAEGVSGLIADTPAAIASAGRHIEGWDRAGCRRHVARHFSLARMADRYEVLFRSALCGA
jgi:glycosyltransferase involved in cell wall biosynthesis